MKIILASASPRRLELLEQIGIHPLVIKSNAEESTDERRPGEFVKRLSEIKCLDVCKRTEEGIVIGADTVVYCNGEILGKPKDRADAAIMIGKIANQVHRVYTGVTLARVKEGKILSSKSFFNVTSVYVSPMTHKEIEEYLKGGEYKDKAGAYGIQGSFGKFIWKIEGDYFNVVGLPLSDVYNAIKELEEEG